MDRDIIVGVSVLASAMGLLTILTLVSRSRIRRIAVKGFGSARKISQELRHG